MAIVTTSTSSFTLTTLGATITIPVVSSLGFVVNDSVLVSVTGTIFALLVTSFNSTNITGIVTQLIVGSPNSTVASGASLVVSNAFQGPAGYGASTTTTPTVIYPIGTKIRFNVLSVMAFPVNTYVLISDGYYGITGQVILQDTVNSVLGVRVLSTLNAVAGSTIASGATVTFTGPPGVAGTTEVGDQGTVLFYDLLVSPYNQFSSELGLTTATALGIVSFQLPAGFTTGLSPNYRVVAELTGTMATNQALTTSNVGYYGIGCSLNGAQPSQIYSAYTSTNYGASNFPTINNIQCVADTPVLIANPATGGGPATTKYVGTFAANSTISFTIYGAATQTYTTINPSASLTVMCYPLYQ